MRLTLSQQDLFAACRRTSETLCLGCHPPLAISAGWTEEALAVQGDEDKIVPPNQVRSSLTSCHRNRTEATYFENLISCQMIMSDLRALLSAALPVT